MGKEPSKYFVYWLNGGRLWSSDNPADHQFMSDTFHLRLLQRDLTGTEHHDIVAVRKTRQKRRI